MCEEARVSTIKVVDNDIETLATALYVKIDDMLRGPGRQHHDHVRTFCVRRALKADALRGHKGRINGHFRRSD